MRKITHSFWFRLLATFLVMLLCTLLILQALTAEMALVCGKEEHTHDEDCYEKELVCTLEEGEGHTHTEDCYADVPVLTCELPEGEGHVHTEDCYAWQRPLLCGETERPAVEGHTHSEACYETHSELRCGETERPAVEGHTHTADCYAVETFLSCTEPESFEEGGHLHGEDCYITSYTLVCPLQEQAADPGHTHTEACYETHSVLCCGEEERPADPGHTHTEECWGEEEQVLACGQEEYEAHEHTESCYTLERQLTCGLEEGEAHEHTDDCYVIPEEPNCDKKEHKHSDLCYSDHTADVESVETWDGMFRDFDYSGVWAEDLIAVAKSQLSYAASTRNYILDENDVPHGYTRYGHWYNNACYAPWCADFVSFCLHYAGIPQQYVPRDEGCGSFIRKLDELGLYRAAEEYLPASGDLIFFDWDGNGTADHVGLVEYTDDEWIHTIEGNVNASVTRCSYPWGDYRILGYGSLAKAYDRFLLDTADEVVSERPEYEFFPLTPEEIPDWYERVELSTPEAEEPLMEETPEAEAAEAEAAEPETVETPAPVALWRFTDRDGRTHYRIYGTVNGVGPGFFAADEDGALLTPLTENWQALEEQLSLASPIDLETERLLYLLENITLTAQYGDLTVKLIAPPGALPEGELALSVSEPPLEKQEEVDKLMAEVQKYFVLDITILCDGEPVQPSKPVEVVFVGAQGLFSTEEPITAYHFGEAEDGTLTATERIETTVTEDGDVIMPASGFSSYAIGGGNPVRSVGTMTGYAAALRDRSNYIGVASEFSDSPYTIDREVWGGTQVNIRDEERDVGGTLSLRRKDGLGVNKDHSYDAEQYYDNKLPFRFTAAAGDEGYTLRYTTYNDRALEDGRSPYAAMKFDNLYLEIIPGISQMNFFARGNKLVMGEGLTTQGSKTWRIFGGTEHNRDLFPNGRPDIITDVVVASGHWDYVFGGGQGATGRGTDVNGNVTSGTQVTIRGNASVDNVYGGGERKGSINIDDDPGPGSADTNGRGVNVFIEGGSVGTLYGGSAINRSATGIITDADDHVVINEDININVTGGHVDRIVAGDDTRNGGDNNRVGYTVLRQSPVNGDATVNLYAANSVGSVYGDMERNTPFSTSQTGVRQVKGLTRLNVYANQSFNTVDRFDLVNIEGATVSTASQMGWTMNDATLSPDGSTDGYIGQIRVVNGGKLVLTQRAVINRPYTHYAPIAGSGSGGSGYSTSSQYVSEVDKIVQAANHPAYYLTHGWIGETSEDRRYLSTVAINGQSTGISPASGTSFNDSSDVCGLLIHGGVVGALGNGGWQDSVPGYSTLEVLGTPIYSTDTEYYYYIVADGVSSNRVGTTSIAGPSANGGMAFKGPDDAPYVVCYRYLDGGTKIGWYLRERPTVTMTNSLVHVGDTTPVTATVDLGGLAYEWDSDSALNRVAVNITRTVGSIAASTTTVQTLTISKADLANLSSLSSRITNLTYLSDNVTPKTFTLVVDDFSDNSGAQDQACYYTVSVDYDYDDTRAGCTADCARCVYDFVKNGAQPTDADYQDSIMTTTPYVSEEAKHEGADKAKLILNLPYGCAAASFTVIEEKEAESNTFWMTNLETGEQFQAHLENKKALEQYYASQDSNHSNTDFAVVFDEKDLYIHEDGTHISIPDVSGSTEYVCAVYSHRNVNVRAVSHVHDELVNGHTIAEANRVKRLDNTELYAGEVHASVYQTPGTHEGLDIDLQLFSITKNGAAVGSGDPKADNWGELRILTVPLTFTVTYDVNTEYHGSGTAPVDTDNPYRPETQATVLSPGDGMNATDQNYHFAGWNTRADGTGTPYSPSDLLTVMDDITLYAQWSNNRFAVQKIWQDSDNSDQLRPSSVTVQLQKTSDNGTTWVDVGDPVVLDESHNWYYDFTDSSFVTTPAIDFSAENIDDYRVVENNTGYTGGYQLAGSTRPYAFAVQNTLRTASFRLRKENSEGRPLIGALFTLTRSGSGSSVSLAPNNEGIVEFNSLHVGTYTLVEEHAPAGYKIPTYSWTVTVTDSNTGYDGTYPLTVAIAKNGTESLTPENGVYHITNEPNLPLPRVGGLGTALVNTFSFGIVLLSFGMIFLLKSGRSKAGKGGDRPKS